jgi:hypothetical protein
MQHPKLVVVAAMAVISMSAVMVASAAAITPAAILQSLPNETVTVTGKQTSAGVLTVLGNTAKIECKTETLEGSFAAGATLGPVKIDFGECKEVFTATTCTGLGETLGTILVSGEAHLVVDVESPFLGAGLLFLVNLTHFTCGAVILMEVKSEVLCLIKPTATKTTKFEVVCEETAASSGDPKEIKYWDSSGTEQIINHQLGGLLTSVNHAAFKGSAERTTAELTSSKEITIDA